MNDDPTEKVPDGVIKLDVGCFRQKTPREMSLNTEAALKRIFEQGLRSLQRKEETETLASFARL